jgi:hypothetical protein
MKTRLYLAAFAMPSVLVFWSLSGSIAKVAS